MVTVTASIFLGEFSGATFEDILKEIYVYLENTSPANLPVSLTDSDGMVLPNTLEAMELEDLFDAADNPEA
jgi:hypothetical protein